MEVGKVYQHLDFLIKVLEILEIEDDSDRLLVCLSYSMHHDLYDIDTHLESDIIDTPLCEDQEMFEYLRKIKKCNQPFREFK